MHPPPPNTGWVKLNIDAAINLQAAGGELLRDNQGKWITGFIIKLGCCSVLEAECWSLQHGLTVASTSGYTSVIAETDCKQVVDIVSSESLPRLPLRNIMIEIRRSLENGWQVQLNCIPREANKAADILASSALNHQGPLTTLNRPPEEHSLASGDVARP